MEHQVTATLPPEQQIVVFLEGNPCVLHSARTLRPAVGYIDDLPNILATMASQGVLEPVQSAPDPEDTIYRFARRN